MKQKHQPILGNFQVEIDETHLQDFEVHAILFF